MRGISGKGAVSCRREDVGNAKAGDPSASADGMEKALQCTLGKMFEAVVGKENHRMRAGDSAELRYDLFRIRDLLQIGNSQARIRDAEVRLIDENGEMVGVVSSREALEMAEEASLDLIEISPNAVPPVAKISDYGKYKYEAQKKAHEARKHQKVIEVKEIKMRPNIDDHDYEVKMRAMKRFIEEGDKVKVTLRFRGREMVHSELGLQVLNRVRGEMDPLTKIESMPRMEGRQMIMVLAPK